MKFVARMNRVMKVYINELRKFKFMEHPNL